MNNLPIRAALAFTVPVLIIFAYWLWDPRSDYFLLAGPLCGVVGGLAFGRRWGFPIVLGICFGLIGFLFSLQDARSAWFSDVIWTTFVSAFLFWLAGGCAMLALPTEMRFNGAASLAVPGAIAGMAFQLIYGPVHFLFNLQSRWEHLVLWFIAAAGGGLLLGLDWQHRSASEDETKYREENSWALASIVCGILGLLASAVYLFRSTLPFGLFNTLSPSAVAADWVWGWGWLAGGVAAIAVFQPKRRLWTAGGLALALILIVASFRVEANPWKSRFNSSYAEKLLRDNPDSGDAIYAGNLILAQAALDNNDNAAAKQYLLQAAGTPGARRIEQNGLDFSVARVLFDRGEKDAVAEYIHRGRTLWPQGAQNLSRMEAAIKAGRRPNFNARGGPGGGGQGQGNQ
jgi:hypothetical protein